MSLILCLEDSAGKDTNLEVKPTDDFASFLQRAKIRLGYVPQLSDITEGKQVSLKDNIYKFLIEAERRKDNPDGEDELSEEYGEIEYLTEDEASEPILNNDANQDNFGSDMEEYSQMEFLDEDSEESEFRDVEILDSSLEEDFEDLGKSNFENHKRKLSEFEEELGDFKNALSDLLSGEVPEVIEEKKQLYTNEDLLDMLGGSPERSESKDNKPSAKRFKSDDDRKSLSSSDLAMLKRSVRQPTISLLKHSDKEIELCMSSPEELRKFIERYQQQTIKVTEVKKNVFLDDSRYLPSTYEDIDNEGIYDYMNDFELQTDVNDLLMIRKDKKPTKNDDVIKAVGGITKVMGIDKKFPLQVPGKRPRGRPRKCDKPNNVVNSAKKYTTDSHMTYLGSVVKSEPIDDDDDYVPGQNIDWSKKKKKKLICRMCGFSFQKVDISQSFSHALSHRVPGKPVFPCIFCPYGFTTYGELEKHMKEEHKKGSPKKSVTPKLNNTLTPSGKPRGKPGRKPKAPYLEGVKVEIVDNEEVCDVEILEEWLEDDEYENLIKNEMKLVQRVEQQQQQQLQQQQLQQQQQQQQQILQSTVDSLTQEEDDDMKQISKSDEIDFVPSGDEEWLLEEEDDEAIYSDESDTKKESRSLLKKKSRNAKLWKHKCDVCLNYYATEDILKNHKCGTPNLKSTKGPHRCALCGQSFISRKRLVYHKTSHQAELLDMKQICAKCPDKKFANENDLFDHINNEHNIDFVCLHQGCNKKFHLRSALRAHARIHGKKCHQCNVCGKQFYDIHNLKEHNITHLAVKPFQCHICLKFLNRRSRLRMHLLSHESCPVENNVLCCKHCKMAFKDAEEAENHITISEECRNAIISNIDRTELLDVLDKIDVKMDAKNEILSESCEQTKAESTVDDIVNETLAKNGIVDVPIMTPNSEMINGDMKTLLDEVGTVKMMLSDDEVKGIVNEQFQRGEATDNLINNDIATKSNCELMQDIGTVKDLLNQVCVDMQTLNENDLGKDMQDDGSCVNYFIDSAVLAEDAKIKDDSDVNLNTNMQETERTETSVDNTKSTNKKIVSEEELLAQLKEQTKAFITVVKTKMVLRCEYCEKAFHTKEALTAHRKCHEGLRNPFICNVCNVAFSTYARCTSHKTTHGFFKLNLDVDDKERSSQDVSGFESFPVVKYFLCQHCNKTFLHWTYLQVHRRHKHGQGTYYFNCKICGEKFTDSWALNSHRRKVHADTINIKKSTNTSYRCADCGEGFNKRIMLAKHRQERHGDSSLLQLKNRPGPFACTSCDKMYQTKVGLDGHMRSHNGGVYLCDLCGNGFTHRAGLETHHRRVHLREVKYTCRDCGQSFFTPDELVSHKRCHTGEKPYPCDFCDMSFRTKGRRNEHHRTHTGERPYPCDLCGLAFRRSNAMKNHRLTHTGERRYTCPYCPKLFHVQSTLKSHIKMKHPEEYVVLEVKGGSDVQSALASLNMINDNDQDGKEEQEMIQTGDGSQMLVLEDVIIEDESGGVLRPEGTTNIMEYTYTADSITGGVGNEISEDFTEDQDKNIKTKIHIQLLEESDINSGHLLYTVGDSSVADNEIHLIDGGVHYELVESIGDDQKHQQYTIIDGDQFIKEEGEGHNQFM